MNDRELIERAARSIGAVHQDNAKRVGIELIIHETAIGPFWMVNGRHTGGWDPLNDDADAFGLARKLGLIVNFNDGTVRNQFEGLLAISEVDIRIAIVRAAAAMAKTTA